MVTESSETDFEASAIFLYCSKERNDVYGCHMEVVSSYYENSLLLTVITGVQLQIG